MGIINSRQAYTELLDDVQQSTSDELDDLLKVYRYNLNNAGIRTDPVIGKDIVMNGDTYIYGGNLYLTGNINKGLFNATSGTWTQQEILNDYFVMKGVKTSNGLSIDATTKLLQYNLNSDYYTINASNQLFPVLEFKGIKPNNGLFIDSITKQLEFKYDTSNLTLDVNNKFKINIGYSLMMIIL